MYSKIIGDDFLPYRSSIRYVCCVCKRECELMSGADGELSMVSDLNVTYKC